MKFYFNMMMITNIEWETWKSLITTFIIFVDFEITNQ